MAFDLEAHGIAPAGTLEQKRHGKTPMNVRQLVSIVLVAAMTWLKPGDMIAGWTMNA
jgi:hypothetical protein